jgi:hypothetical protein
MEQIPTWEDDSRSTNEDIFGFYGKDIYQLYFFVEIGLLFRLCSSFRTNFAYLQRISERISIFQVSHLINLII